MKLHRCLFAVSIVLSSVSVAAAAEPDAAPPMSGEAIVYKEIDGRALRMFVIKPADWKADDRRPAIVFFHGGGWRGGTPKQFEQQSIHFAGRGAVCASVEYRFVKSKTTEPPELCIQDAKSAMRWVRGRAAELGIDPARIAAGGGSAGGHLAAATGMLAGHDDPKDDLKVSPRPDALILFNGVIDNSKEGYGTERIGDRLKEFSPAHNVTPAAPPTIIFIGSEDKIISPPLVDRFQKAMRAAGVRCEAKVYDGQPHGFFNYDGGKNKYYHETLREADAFLTSLGWLKPAEK